ncbi:hypothetical protein FRC12_001655 [Ceratobasidium sp. 428]|nr:hypothetical protein FRC12_001655 [Ceratobasidium sp. 428]
MRCAWHGAVTTLGVSGHLGWRVKSCAHHVSFPLGATKKSVAIAMIVAFGNFGGLIASYTYIAKNAPRYYSGHGTLLAILAMGAVVALIMHLYCKHENLRRDRDYKPPAEYTESEKALESRRGDQASFFRFID